ncbi:MAG: DUF72 domain-containing protein [Planctomycetota bacterium]
MTTQQKLLHVGTSGWQYRHWAGVFYPDDIPKKRWFEHYAATFDTVEINNTFYNLPKGETFDDWRRRAPEGFGFTLKFSRYGTHLKRLKDPSGTIGMFLDRAERLGEALGPILVQLPPNFNPDAERLAAFLDEAPRRHRWAVEFRNPDWLCERIYAVLRDHNAALVVHDLIDDHPHVATADWVYLRFHGAGDGGDYTPQALTASARRIKDHLSANRHVYAYFNNDAEGYAVANARDLRRYVLGD